jgi:hypothetical protein
MYTHLEKAKDYANAGHAAINLHPHHDALIVRFASAKKLSQCVKMRYTAITVIDLLPTKAFRWANRMCMKSRAAKSCDAS